MRYNFSKRRGIILSPRTVDDILEGRKSVPINIGLERAYARKLDDKVIFTVSEVEFQLDYNMLDRLKDSDKLLFLGEDGELYFVEVRSGDHYFKLRYLGENVWPTLEIDGIHMHNITGTDPRRDALYKVKLAGVRRGHRVLDVCTGLGYTAVTSIMRGARVTTIELRKEVLWIAEHNPYSGLLEKAEIYIGDAYEMVGEIDYTFDRVIHDPPVFSHAGLLYSSEFYRRLYRLLRPGGRLFHYTGAPGSRRGINIQKGVARRLRESGFKIERIIKGYGIVARRI